MLELLVPVPLVLCVRAHAICRRCSALFKPRFCLLLMGASAQERKSEAAIQHPTSSNSHRRAFKLPTLDPLVQSVLVLPSCCV